MVKRIKVASWNIAGGRSIKSLSQFDYDQENLSYFADQLIKVNADIICLQETHFNDQRTTAEELAKLLNLSFFYTHPCHESHIDPKYMMSNSIISKIEPKSIGSVPLPYPEFDLYWPSGKPAKRYVKQLEYAIFENFNLYNTQLIPLGLFGVKYDSDKASDYSRKLETELIKQINPPALFCGDFSGDFPEDRPDLVFKELFTKVEFTDSIPHQTTRPKQDGLIHQTDHIFFTKEFRLINSEIKATQTDHYLCLSEFEII